MTLSVGQLLRLALTAFGGVRSNRVGGGMTPRPLRVNSRRPVTVTDLMWNPYERELVRRQRLRPKDRSYCMSIRHWPLAMAGVRTCRFSRNLLTR